MKSFCFKTNNIRILEYILKRIDEIDLSTDEEVLPEPSKPLDEEEDDFDDEDEEPSLDDLEFPDDIDDMEGEGEE